MSIYTCIVGRGDLISAGRVKTCSSRCRRPAYAITVCCRPSTDIETYDNNTAVSHVSLHAPKHRLSVRARGALHGLAQQAACSVKSGPGRCCRMHVGRSPREARWVSLHYSLVLILCHCRSEAAHLLSVTLLVRLQYQHYSVHKRAFRRDTSQLSPAQTLRQLLALPPTLEQGIVDVLHAEQPRTERRLFQPIGTLPTCCA
jgi:hypothetical protein